MGKPTFGVSTDCTVSKTLSGSYQPHGSPAVNGAVPSSKQLSRWIYKCSISWSPFNLGTGTTFTIQR